MKKKMKLRIEFPSLETFQSRLTVEFFSPIWKKQKPVSLNSKEIIHCSPLACAVAEIRLR